MSARLEAGETWDAALAAPDVRLPAHIQGLILAGLRTGRLAESLERLVDIQHRSQQVRREIWLSLAYPVTLLGLLIALFICYEAGFVSQMAQVYQDFDMQLPEITQLVISWSQPQSVATMVIGAVALAICIVLQALVQPIWLALCFNQIPLLGSLWRWAALTDFARLLGLLVRADIPLPEALRMTAVAIRNGPLRETCRRLAAGVEQGQSLSAAMKQSDAVPATMTAVIEWGEARASLPEALTAAADMFAGRVQVQMSFVRTFLPPFTFIVVAGVIAFAVLAMFVPLFKIIETLS